MPHNLDDADQAIVADAWLAHLRAVYADGTEVDVGGSPFAVGPEFVPIINTWEYDSVGLVPTPTAPQAVAPAAAAAPPSPTTTHTPAPLLAAILGVLLTVGALSWRQRIRPPPAAES